MTSSVDGFLTSLSAPARSYISSWRFTESPYVRSSPPYLAFSAFQGFGADEGAAFDREG